MTAVELLTKSLYFPIDNVDVCGYSDGMNTYPVRCNYCRAVLLNAHALAVHRRVHPEGIGRVTTNTGWVADWTWRLGMNSKQALVYKQADPTEVYYCEHRHRKVKAATLCAEEIVARLGTA